MAKTEVTLYNKPSCPQCTATERKLNELEIDFEHKSALDDENRIYIVEELGYMSAPVVTVIRNGELIDHWSGYRPDKIGDLVA